MTAPEETLIVAGRGGRRYMHDLWLYRELFFFLAWRDLLVRYKQTVVGIVWSVIKPLLTVLVLTFVFKRLGNMPTAGVPYPLLVLCGLLPWQFFVTAMWDSGSSLLASSGLITKVYFPRLVIPAGTLMTSLVEFMISLMFLFGLMVWYRFMPPARIVLLPLFLLLVIAVSFGAGLWVAAVTVKYRDFRVILPFVIQFGLYVSPVGFVSSVVPEHLRVLYSLNPIVGVIDGFRWCALGGEHTLYMPALAISVVSGLVLLLTGVWYFHRMERTFADVI
jgi:lipopolysaccharide transport system permease protein